MDEKAINDMIERSKAHWDQVDVEKFAPVFHGPPPSEAQRLAAAERAKRVEELEQLYQLRLKEERENGVKLK